jgi:hypothetical protein
MSPWRIVELEVLPGYRLRLTFADGLEGVLDLSRFVCADLAGTVFEPLREEAFLRQAHLQLGAVTWPGDVDMAPDAMYRDIRDANGYFCVPVPTRKVA